MRVNFPWEDYTPNYRDWMYDKEYLPWVESTASVDAYFTMRSLLQEVIEFFEIENAPVFIRDNKVIALFHTKPLMQDMIELVEDEKFLRQKWGEWKEQSLVHRHYILSVYDRVSEMCTECGEIHPSPFRRTFSDADDVAIYRSGSRFRHGLPF